LIKHRKIEYEPLSVREILKDMKNISELMIDLAYSATLFHSQNLAEEVLELEERIDTLVYLLNMNLMIAARDSDDAEALIGISEVAAATDKISDAAADAASIVIKEIGVHPIIRESFKSSEEKLARLEVDGTSRLINRKLEELDLAAEMGVDIIAIRRGKKCVINPRNDEKILEDDIIFVRGAPSGTDKLANLVKGKKKIGEKEPLRITRQFKKIANKLTVLKNTSELMIDLAYSSILFNRQQLAEEVEELEDYVDNLHTAYELLVLSTDFEPKKPKYILGLLRLGVVTEMIADAAQEIAQVVLRGLKPHPILSQVIEEAEETVTRVQVLDGSPLKGKTLREAKIPEETGMWVLVIRRGKRFIRPKPKTVIRTGDFIIASGYAEGEEDLMNLASG
jgi:uncharacterized protein with PhoU and TrkA domain